MAAPGDIRTFFKGGVRPGGEIASAGKTGAVKSSTTPEKSDAKKSGVRSSSDAKAIHNSAGKKLRKRKVVDLDEEEDDDTVTDLVAKPSPPKTRTTPKRAAAKKNKVIDLSEEEDSSVAQDLDDDADEEEPPKKIAKSKYFNGQPSASGKTTNARVTSTSAKPVIQPSAQPEPKGRANDKNSKVKRKSKSQFEDDDDNDQDYDDMDLDGEDSKPVKVEKSKKVPTNGFSTVSANHRPESRSQAESVVKNTGAEHSNISKDAPRPAHTVNATSATLDTSINAPDPFAQTEKPKEKFDYSAYKARQSSGPAAPGSKPIPEGKAECLAGLSFVFTGELSSISREDAVSLAKRYGGKVVGAPSGKTDYIVVGENAGASKIKKIEELQKKNPGAKIQMIDEDKFFNLIAASGSGSNLDDKGKKKQETEMKKVQEMAQELVKAEKSAIKEKGKDQALAELWTVKYAPRRLADICGNKGMVEKLSNWLRDWPTSLKSNFKKPGKDLTGSFKAVLISGPPGIGKTTSAHLVARLQGYAVVELNASDVRSKKLIESSLTGILDNKSLDGWMSKINVDPEAKANNESRPTTKKALAAATGAQVTDKMVIIMDEVDGMSGGDRGGVGAINALIKKTRIPIICICNDSSSPKMKPFQFTTFGMKFAKPRPEMIRSRIMSICYKEGIKVSGEVIDQLVEGSQSDIRQILNMLSTWRLSSERGQSMNYDQGKALVEANEKNSMLRPWDIYSKLFSPYMFSKTSKATLNDKIELYFNDHDFAPLMVQENYLKQMPRLVDGQAGQEGQLKTLRLFTKASLSISDGDLVDRMIRGTQPQWSLMPLHGVFSCVKPAALLYGTSGRPEFTSWMGNNSKQGRLQRLLGDIQIKMRLKITGSRQEVRQLYLPTLFPRITQPLLSQKANGVPAVIESLDEYFLNKEDWEAVLDLGLWPNDGENVMKALDTATKTAFTRLYNKASHPIAFHRAQDVGLAAKKLKGDTVAPDNEDAMVNSDDEELEAAAAENAEEGDEVEETLGDVSKDKLVKAKAKPNRSTASATAGTSKGRGRGR